MRAPQTNPPPDLQPPPLSTLWNPQLDLFLEAPDLRHGAGRGPLWAEQWWRQARRLARNAGSNLLRRAAAETDLLRPGPAAAPLPAEYDWEWPSFTSLALDDRFADAPLSRFVLTRLQGDEQRAALSGLLREIAQHVAFALSRPCPVYATASQLRVEFLGCIAWVANREWRSLQLELRDQDGAWQLAMPGFNLLHALADGQWIEQALLPWLPQIERIFGPGAATAHDWLREKLAARYLHGRCLDATARQVRHCLVRSPALARVLRRIPRHRPPRQPLSAAYTALWLHEAFWTRLEGRAPGLLLFYYLAARRNLVRPGDDLGLLRARCRALGLSPAGWRFLCRFGEWAYDGLLPGDEAPEDSAPFEWLVALLEWQAAAGLRQPLHACFVDSLVAAGALRRDAGGRVAVVLDPRLARVAATQVSGPLGAGRVAGPGPIDLDEWIRVLRWMVKERPAFDRNQWRAGWPALRRAHDAWLRRRLERGWDSRVGPFSVDGWSVRPLTTAGELVAEGQRMRHCVASYLDACLAGRYRLFTVEHPETGAPAATIGLRQQGGEWQLGQVRGPHNAAAGPAMEMLGLEVLGRYRGAE